MGILKKIQGGNLSAQFYQGQLVSLKLEEREFMHGGGKPESERQPSDNRGWQHSEIVMFPVISTVKDYTVALEDVVYPHDQHGISRVLPWQTSSLSRDSVTFIQHHDGIEVPNPRVYKPGSPKTINWCEYEIRKQISLNENELTVGFTVHNKSFSQMRFMLGWHPAFRAREKGEFVYDDGKLSIEEIAKGNEGGNAYKLRDRTSVEYHSLDEKIRVSAEGFNHIALWTPDPKSGMFCMEPFTHIPRESGDYFNTGNFETLDPNKKETYKVKIETF